MTRPAAVPVLLNLVIVTMALLSRLNGASGSMADIVQGDGFALGEKEDAVDAAAAAVEQRDAGAAGKSGRHRTAAVRGS